jgi:putative membrane protein
MSSTRTLSDKILLFIKGLAMGAANKVPGVSGGTVAFVVGFYEELIYSLQKINSKAFKLLFSGRFKSFFQYVNGRFLLLIFAGSTFSYFSVSKILDYFIQHFELFVWSTFFGMIIGSIYYIGKDFKDWSRQNIIAIIVGITIGVAISFMDPAKENDNLWFVFFCGIIGVSGMTLPGLSGSFILILMGNYVLLLVDSVNELFKIIMDIFSFNFDFIQDQVRIRYLKIITSFTLGSVFGLVVTSHILGFLLKRYHQIVTALIIGFIAGSLGIVWPWKKEIYKIENGIYLLDREGHKIIQNYQRYFPDISEPSTWYAIGYIIFGIAILLAIDLYGRSNGKK